MVWVGGLGVEDEETTVETCGGGGGNKVLCVSSTQPGRSYNLCMYVQHENV